MHRAAYCGHKDVVRVLVQNGADVGAVDADGMTALHKVRVCTNPHSKQEFCDSISPQCSVELCYIHIDNSGDFFLFIVM